jgi:hypothetical protein
MGEACRWRSSALARYVALLLSLLLSRFRPLATHSSPSAERPTTTTPLRARTPSPRAARPGLHRALPQLARIASPHRRADAAPYRLDRSSRALRVSAPRRGPPSHATTHAVQPRVRATARTRWHSQCDPEEGTSQSGGAETRLEADRCPIREEGPEQGPSDGHAAPVVDAALGRPVHRAEPRPGPRPRLCPRGVSSGPTSTRPACRVASSRSPCGRSLGAPRLMAAISGRLAETRRPRRGCVDQEGGRGIVPRPSYLRSPRVVVWRVDPPKAATEPSRR